MDFSAMWLQKNKLLSGCTRVSPLLTAYSEGSLPPAETARVAAHLSLCPSCAKEAEDFATLSVLLRANPPKAALPAPDLWLRLEAQIRAEGGGTVSEKRRAPNLRFTPVFGTMAAAALVGGAVMLTLPLTKPSKANKTRGLDAAQVASTVTREKHRLPLDTSAGIIEAAKQEAVVAAVDPELSADEVPAKRLSRKGYQTASRPDPFFAARQSNQSASLPREKPRLTETPPKRKSRPVQVALVKQSSPRPAKTAAMGAAAPSEVADSIVAAPVPGVVSEGLLATTATEKPVLEPNRSSELPTYPPRTRIAVASLPSGTEPTTAPDMVAARDIPAAATTVAEMSGPLRRQSGLFSYQAR